MFNHDNIVLELAKKTGATVHDTKSAIDLYFKGIATIIRKDEPSTIIMPFFGKLIPNKTFLKKHETNND